MMSWWTCAEWVGSVAFAVDGALTAKRRDMDLVGISAVALAETVGGGTLRDVMLGRTPVGWLTDGRLPAMVLAVAFLVAVVRPPAGLIARWRWLPPVLDAIGLGCFAIVGTSIAAHAGCSPIACILLGTVSGAFGGVLRDLFCAEIPTVFRRTPLYATPALAGSAIWIGCSASALATAAPVSGLLAAVGLRLAALRWNWRLPC